MVAGDAGERLFSKAIRRWQAVGKAPGESPPVELVRAEWLDAIARRYGVLPTTVLEADADELLSIQAILNEAEEW